MWLRQTFFNGICSFPPLQEYVVEKNLLNGAELSENKQERDEELDGIVEANRSEWKLKDAQV